MSILDTLFKIPGVLTVAVRDVNAGTIEVRGPGDEWVQPIFAMLVISGGPIKIHVSDLVIDARCSHGYDTIVIYPSGDPLAKSLVRTIRRATKPRKVRGDQPAPQPLE
jgi:hypothetical protein